MRSLLAFEPPNQIHGLQNRSGENNCFLNVAIQALWHLGPFREQLKGLLRALASEGALLNSTQDTSILAALCNLFVQYEFAEEEVLPPTELRESLCKLSDKFQLGSIADANEALDAILQRIHLELRGICPHKLKCLSHATFGGMILEQIICKECGASSEPNVRNNFLLYFQAVELIQEGKQSNPPVELINLSNLPKPSDASSSALPFFSFSQSNTSKPTQYGMDIDNLRKSVMFGKLLRQCMTSLGDRSCPSVDNSPSSRPNPPCQGHGAIHFYSLDPPLALALSLSWDASRQSVDNLHMIYSLISDRLYLNDLFSDEMASTSSSQLFDLPPILSLGCGNTEREDTSHLPQRGGPSYVFRGMVCFYGCHYVSIFQVLTTTHTQKDDNMKKKESKQTENNAASGLFYLFDDQNVRPIGQWVDVVKLCLASIYQPVLLLYELESSSTAYCRENLVQDYPVEVVRELLVDHWNNSAFNSPGDTASPSLPSPVHPARLQLSNHTAQSSHHTEEVITHEPPSLTSSGSSREESKGLDPSIAADHKHGGFVRFDKKGIPHRLGGDRLGSSGSKASQSSPSQTQTVTTLVADPKKKALFIEQRPFDKWDEEVDKVRKRWDLPSLRPSSTTEHAPPKPSDGAKDGNIVSAPPVDSAELVESYLDFQRHPSRHHHTHSPLNTNPNAIIDRNPYRALYPNTKEEITAYHPIITHWFRKYQHYIVNVPVLIDPQSGLPTLGLSVCIDENNADRYPMVANFLENSSTGQPILPPHILERIHLFDHIIQVNNIDISGMALEEVLASVNALVSSCELLTFHFQTCRAYLCFYCRACHEANVVDRAVENRLAMLTNGGKKKLIKAVRIRCQHCGIDGLAMDYQPE